MCLSLTCYMFEMSKWFDLHFAMSKISKGKILKLSLVSKSDVYNAWTQQVIDVASKTLLILFLSFASWNEIFMFASCTNWCGTSQI